jgi:hypothetical protein
LRIGDASFLHQWERLGQPGNSRPQDVTDADALPMFTDQQDGDDEPQDKDGGDEPPVAEAKPLDCLKD